MGPRRRILPRRRRRRALAAVVLVALGSAAAWLLLMPGRGPQGPLEPPASIGQATPEPSGAPGPTSPGGPEGGPVRAARVPDVPLAWQRIREQARGWPAAAAPVVRGEALALPTVPASRVRDTLGLNIDTWRTEAGYADFRPILAKVAELQLRHARVNMSATGGAWGVDRLRALGQIGVRLNVVMGDAFGRYGTAPYRTLDRRLQDGVMPYVDALEGTNEPDLAEQDDWVQGARAHQEQVVASAAPRRGRPVAVVAPSVGRIANVRALGSLAGQADASNAHAYSSAGEPSAPMDAWLQTLPQQLPGGPVLITEAGFQDDLRQTRWHSPLPAEIAADYVPRIILEAVRRGIPRVYLYEMINRWSDPFHVDTAAHFGLLDHELRPKPAWTTLVRLQATLLDGGRPDREVDPLTATVEQGPDDLRVLALRRRDGTAAVAVWRAVSQWDSAAQERTPVRPEPVRLAVEGDTEDAAVTEISTGRRQPAGAGGTIELSLTGGIVVIDGIR